MIQRVLLDNFIFFDLETVGLYATLDDASNADPHLAELWIKRCKWLQKQLDSSESKDPGDLWLSKSALHPEFGKVVCASFGLLTPDGNQRITSFFGEDEYDILQKSNKIIANSRIKGFKIAGQNIKNFDIPYLGKRMLINKIVPDTIIQTWNKKPWETSFIDLAEIFAFGAWGQTFSSLDLISHVLGVTGSKDKMEGAQVHENYWNNKLFVEIKDYCEQDVVCTINCFLRISS